MKILVCLLLQILLGALRVNKCRLVRVCLLNSCARICTPGSLLHFCILDLCIIVTFMYYRFIVQVFDLVFLALLSYSGKVSFCGHTLSVVHHAYVCLSVHASVNSFFKRHLLLNHWLIIDQTSQQWFLVGPLSKLIKWLWSIVYLGHKLKIDF